jgi:hypothetical protein
MNPGIVHHLAGIEGLLAARKKAAGRETEN